MNSSEFLRRVRRYARNEGLAFSIDSRAGKGSHQKIEVGSRFTFVPRGEIRAGLLNALLKQLDIDRKEW